MVVLNCIGLALVTLVFYWRTFKYGLVSDDVPAYTKTRSILCSKPNEEIDKLRVDLSKAPEKKALHETLIKLEEARKFPFWEGLYWDLRGVYNAKRCHIISVMYHMITVVLIYLAFHNIWAALLFAFNPINLMVSVWIAGRAYGFATMIALASWVIPSNAIIFYTIAVYWNISALFYPLLFGYLGWKWTWLALMVIPATYWRFTAKEDHVSLKINSKLLNESNLELRTFKPNKVIIWIKTYGYYFREVLFSFRLGLFHKFLYTFGLNKKDNSEWYALVNKYELKRKDKVLFKIWYPNFDLLWGLVTLGITMAGIIFGNYYQSLGCAWFLINVGMWGNLITFNQQIAERYLYLPAVGLMIALCSTFSTNILMLFLVYYMTRTWWFMPSFINEYWSVEYNLAEAKDLYYVWLSRGVHRFGEGKMHEALQNLMQAYLLKPDAFKVNINIFYIALVVNDIELAKKHLKEASICFVDGREEEIVGYIKWGNDLIARIEADFKLKGKCEVPIRDFKLLL